MNIELNEITANVILDALATLLNGGSIELRSDERMLAVLRLSDPAAQPATDGKLEFNDIAEEDAALAQGTATRAIVVGRDGVAVFWCDVGDENSSAVIKLNTTKIARGSPVRLKSFQVTMPQ